jgi:hypothetical protein
MSAGVETQKCSTGILHHSALRVPRSALILSDAPPSRIQQHSSLELPGEILDGKKYDNTKEIQGWKRFAANLREHVARCEAAISILRLAFVIFFCPPFFASFFRIHQVLECGDPCRPTESP